MKQTVLLLFLASALAASGQKFVCGEARTGAVLLNENSIFSPTAAGFDLGSRPEVAGQSCSSTKPFFFSITLPEGSYRVTVKIGGTYASTTTVRAEARRLMLEQITVKAGGTVTRSFDVNLRTPVIAGNAEQTVQLKPRELTSLEWDNKLTLEFNGNRPSFRSLRIVPIHETTIYLAGDSTVVDQEQEPWAAWGQMLPRFFRPGVVVANHAEPGETTRSFIREQRLSKILSLIRPGDTLFIQFAHNDQKPNAVALDDYRKLLADYIAQTRAKAATPVLVTSMNRRTFNDHGQIVDSLGGYPDAMRDVAAQQQVTLIDLNAMSKTLFEAMGPAGTLKAFVHYPANTYSGQTTPLEDETHFNNYGAYELARCIVHGIRQSRLPLSKLLVKDQPDFNPATPDAAATFLLPATPIQPKPENAAKTP